MNRVRRMAFGPVVAGLLTLGLLAGTGQVLAAETDAVVADAAESDLTATLDGRPIPLEDVSKYACDDFAYPRITCYSARVLTDSRALLVTLLTSTDYVTIYDLTGYQGAFMNVSADYPALSLIGWNDRISSFRARNSESGTFYGDWLYGGGWWDFCCNQQAPTLANGWNNAISSIIRT